MTDLNLLKFEIESKVIEGKTYIYDFLRKKYIYMTPEELVRQKFLHYLIKEKKYPRALCKVEGGLKVGKMSKRTDILFYDRKGTPYLLIECKSFKVKLNQNTFDQLAVYNQKLMAKHIGVTNGIEHCFFCVDYHSRKLTLLDSVPEFEE